jgi:hypothetical protein
MRCTFDDLEVGDTTKKALARAKITKPAHLVEKCATPAARAAISKSTGVDAEALRKLSYTADMLRIVGLGGGNARLLLATDIESLLDLRKQSVDLLLQKLGETNGRARPPIVRRLPSEKQLESWIEQAGTLRPAVTG